MNKGVNYSMFYSFDQQSAPESATLRVAYVVRVKGFSKYDSTELLYRPQGWHPHL